MAAQLAHARLADDSLLEHWGRRAALAARQTARLAAWALDPAAYAAPVLAPCSGRFPHLVHEMTVPLRRTDRAAEPTFEEGKRVNVALAAPAFDGLLLDPTHPFSFWRTLGRATEQRGFRLGMELRGGCIVPSVGGGLCLLSNALFETAVRLGCRIVERHGHSLEAVPPGPGLWGLDATVLWPHVDLRFVSPEPRRLEVKVEGDALVIRVRAATPATVAYELVTLEDRLERASEGSFRRNRVGRRRAGSTDVLEVVAENRRRILGPLEQRRNCLNCGETSCQSRIVPGGLR